MKWYRLAADQGNANASGCGGQEASHYTGQKKVIVKSFPDKADRFGVGRHKVLRSTQTPGQGRAHGIIPYQAHSCASDARDPPERMLLAEQQGGDSDICDCPEAADQHERYEAAHESPSGEAVIVVSQQIVKREI